MSFLPRHPRNDNEPTRFVIKQGDRYLRRLPRWRHPLGDWTTNIHEALSFSGWRFREVTFGDPDPVEKALKSINRNSGQCCQAYPVFLTISEDRQ